MLVEPIGKDFHVVGHLFPAVILAFANNQPERRVRLGAALPEDFGLINRHQLVGVAVNDQRGRHVRRDVVDRRDFFAQVPPAFGRVGARAKRRFELRGGTVTNSVFTGLAPVQKIRRRKKARDRLHGAALAVNRVFGLGIARAALRSHGERQMPARARERRRLALADLVEMDAVRAGSEAGDVHAEPHPAALRGDGGVADGLTLGIHQLDRHVPGLRSPRAEHGGQREHDSGGNAVKSLHRGPLLL